MKNILHLKIPVGEGVNNYTITARDLGQVMLLCQDILGKDWEVISFPCEPKLLSRKSKLYTFDVTPLNIDELKGLLTLDKKTEV